MLSNLTISRTISISSCRALSKAPQSGRAGWCDEARQFGISGGQIGSIELGPSGCYNPEWATRLTLLLLCSLCQPSASLYLFAQSLSARNHSQSRRAVVKRRRALWRGASGISRRKVCSIRMKRRAPGAVARVVKAGPDGTEPLRLARRTRFQGNHGVESQVRCAHQPPPAASSDSRGIGIPS